LGEHRERRRFVEIFLVYFLFIAVIGYVLLFSAAWALKKLVWLLRGMPQPNPATPRSA
jgi:hypothetical protein